jgi:hypothetical protein
MILICLYDDIDDDKASDAFLHEESLSSEFHSDYRCFLEAPLIISFAYRCSFPHYLVLRQHRLRSAIIIVFRIPAKVRPLIPKLLIWS